MLPTVYETLTADSAVFALVGEEIYRHGEAPQEIVAPYVTWFVVSAPPENQLEGAPRVDRYEIQVDCWSKADAGVEELAQAVRNALEVDHHMTAVVFNGRDPETRKFRIGMTFTWWQHR